MTDEQSTLMRYEQELLEDEVIGDYFSIKVRWMIRDSDDTVTTLLPVIFTSRQEARGFLRAFAEGDSEVNETVGEMMQAGLIPVPPQGAYKAMMACVVSLAVIPF